MIKIKNWHQFQHYTKRTPPWIKLHRTILDDYEWHCLQDASKALALCLWILASEEKDPSSGVVTRTPEEIAFRARCDVKKVNDALQDLEDKGFIENASKMLATRYQDAMLETEAEAEAEAEVVTLEKDFSESLIKWGYDWEDSDKCFKPAGKGLRISPHWELSAEWQEWAEKNFSVSLEEIDRCAEKFKDYWLSEDARRPVKKDWLQAWRSWCRTEFKGKERN